MLTLTKVTKTFGKKVAVDCAELKLLPGERLCLLGHNGAGKTTLMRMIAGIARPTDGTILMFGEDPLTEPSQRRSLGYLSDKPYIYDKLTCREHLRLHAALYDLSREKVASRGIELLQSLEMGSVLDQRTETFSFGMQKKLALAMAIAHEPKLLILDEPLNGLDPGSADQVEGLLKYYSAEDRALIVSTHSPEFAARFANRIGTMEEGQLSLHHLSEETSAEWVHGLLVRDGLQENHVWQRKGEQV